MLQNHIFSEIVKNFKSILVINIFFSLTALFNFQAVFAQSAPYPSSTVIEGITFDFNTDEQHGAGSDQWVMSWADDDQIYGVWGDGWGWSESGPKKAMGVTKINGLPPGLSGSDVWGGDDQNPKPGAIIADSNQTIYLFWHMGADGWDGTYFGISNDNGTSWSLGSTKLFSHALDGVYVVGIAQFGPGYTNIPSGVDGSYFYVYLSGRADGKDGKGKEIYLAKVKKKDIANRSAYSYFNGLDGNGNPKWSSNWSNKQPAFYDPAGMEYHVNVSYNPGIGRFIFAKGQNTSHLGVFEGPTPWGPWSTVYYRQFKDNLWKFTYQFPQKWMSADGLTMWMAWSGWPEYDKVSVIKATLTISNPDTTSPTTPQSLNGTPQSESKIALTWQASDDSESGINKYNIYRDGSNVGQSTKTSFSDTGLNADTTYTYKVSSVNGVGLESPKSVSVSATTFVGTPLPQDGLVGYWRFDEGSGAIASDSSGNGNTGNLINSPTWTTGKIGGALDFDGVDDYVDIGNLDVQGNGLTLSVWFNAKDTQGDQRIISKTKGVSTSNHFWALILSANKLQTRLKINGSTTKLTASTGPVIQNTWTHAIVTFNGNRILVYKDGVEILSKNISGVLSTNNTIPVWIGANPTVIGDNRGFNGLLDGVRIFNRALSATEVQALYYEGTQDTTPPASPLRVRTTP